MDLEAIFVRHLYPVMKDAGFSRQGRRFEKSGPTGNAVAVQVRTFNTLTKRGFHLEWAPIPAALRAFQSGGDIQKFSSVAWGIFYARLKVPAEMRESPYELDLWMFDPSDGWEQFGLAF